MTTCIYASQISQFNSNLVSLISQSGGSTTTATSLYYWFQGLIRGGLNQPTSLGQISVSSGNKLVFSLNNSLPNGCDTFALILSANTTNNVATSKIIAILFLKDSDQETEINSPSIELTHDSHFLLNGTVTNFSDLSGINAIAGSHRFVLSESQYYIYDADGWFPESENSPSWIPVNGVLTAISSLEEPRQIGHLYGGANCPVHQVEPNSTVSLPYGWTRTGEESPFIKLWLINGFTEGSGNVIGTGNRLYLTATINNNTEQGLSTFSGVTEITPKSTIRYSTGTIESSLSNAPVLYSSNTPFYTVTEDLPRGYALEFTVSTSAIFSLSDSFYFLIVNYGQHGNFDPNDFVGSAVFPEDTNNPAASHYARILPAEIGLKRLKGQGRITLNGEIGGYTFNNPSEEFVIGIPDPNTPNQIIAINGLQNGRCRIIQSETDLLISEGIRAIISTESGYQFASDWSNTITVSDDAQLAISFNHPTSIRNDYPDIIANNSNAIFQVDGIVVELRKDDTTSYIYVDVYPSTNPQTILLNTVTGTSSTLPTVETENNFGLFNYSAIAISENAGQGSITSGSYKARIYYYYAGSSVSKISHAVSDGCIPEVSEPLTDITQLGRYWKDPVATKADLKALPIEGILDGQTRICLEENSPYIFRLTLPIADDGENYLASDDGTTEGWVKAGGQSGGGSGISDGDKGDIVISGNATIFSIDSNTITSAKLQDNSVTTAKLQDNAVTNTKLSNVSTSTLKGRITSGTGTVEDLTGTQATTLLDTFTTTLKGLVPAPSSNINAKLLTGAGWLELSVSKGNLLATNGVNFVTLPVGTNNQILIADSSSSSGLAWVDNNASVSTTTSASYIQPSVNSNVTITVGSTNNMIVDAYIDIAVGGYYKVITINSANSVIVQYLGNGVSPGTSVSSGKRIVPSAKAGANGLSAITYTSSSFTVPAINSTVDVFIPDSTIFNPEIYINIESAGIYYVTEIVDGTTIRAKNLGGDNVIAGTTILGNSRIIITGAKGDTGAISAFGKTDTPNTLTSSEAALRVNTSNEAYIDLELTQKKLTFWDAVKDALLTGFTEGTLSAITATDTIIQAFGKIQKYLTDYLTSFNSANQLIKLDGTGKIPAIDGSLITNIPYPVTTVNTQSGTVVLDADDIEDTSTSHKFVTSDDLTKLSNVPTNTNTELGNKQDTLISGTNIKTINSQSLLGSGNLSVTGGHTIEDEGTPLTNRTKLNFVGSNVTVTDDSGNDRTIVTISGSGSGGHTIQDEGVSLTTRSKLNFIGSGVTVTDDSGNDATNVTIASGGASIDSVNGQTGTVVLDADDISDSGTTKKFVTFTGDDISPSLIPNSFTEAKNFTLTTLTDGANIAWNLASNQVAQITLSGNRTLDNPTNQVAGATYLLIIKQDATGSRTLTFSSAYKFSGGVSPVLTTTANKVDIISFISDGTNMYGSFVGDF